MTDAQKAVAKVENFLKFLDKKKDKESREMHDALAFVLMLTREHIRSSL